MGRAKWWVVTKVIGRQSPVVARLRQGGSLVPLVKEAGSDQRNQAEVVRTSESGSCCRW